MKLESNIAAAVVQLSTLAPAAPRLAARQSLSPSCNAPCQDFLTSMNAYLPYCQTADRASLMKCVDSICTTTFFNSAAPCIKCSAGTDPSTANYLDSTLKQLQGSCAEMGYVVDSSSTSASAGGSDLLNPVESGSAPGALSVTAPAREVSATATLDPFGNPATSLTTGSLATSTGVLHNGGSGGGVAQAATSVDTQSWRTALPGNDKVHSTPSASAPGTSNVPASAGKAGVSASVFAAFVGFAALAF